MQFDSKPSLIFLAGFLVTSVMFVIGALTAFNDSSVELPKKLMFVAAALFSTILFVTCATSHYSVTRYAIFTSSVWRSRQIAWQDVKAIKLVPTYFQVFNIQIILQNKRYVGLLTAVMSNRDELHKAIVEAAKNANPDVELNDWVIHEYGQPPYGMFSIQRMNAKR